jgi:hypothetical protein
MGWFSRKPDPAEIRGFGRGKRASGKAAEEWARQQRDKAATRKAQAQRRKGGW